MYHSIKQVTCLNLPEVHILLQCVADILCVLITRAWSTRVIMTQPATYDVMTVVWIHLLYTSIWNKTGYAGSSQLSIPSQGRRNGPPKGVGPNTTLAWPGWKQPYIPVEVDTARLETSPTEAGDLKILSLDSIAKLSQLKYSRLRFVWPQPTIVDSELTIGWCTQLIPQSSMKHLGLVRLT